MIYRLSSKEIESATIDLPASKSISNRLLLINVLCNSPYVPENLSESDDTKVMLRALESDCSLVDVGAAGTSMRFLTAYLASLPGKHVITGSERMKNRPIAVLVEALRDLGAKITYLESEGFPPLEITGGELRTKHITLPGNISSQYISALMMIGPLVDGGITIHLTGKIISRPYINMTLRTMERYGIACSWAGSQIIINEGKYVPRRERVESDWSAASYWYSIAALAPGKEFRLKGLSLNSLQGDSTCVLIGQKLGIATRVIEDGISIVAEKKSPEFFEYDFTNQPDLTQTFVVLCCLIGTKFRFTGLESLRIKETDRIAALVTECAKLGYVLSTNNVDMIEWDGEMCKPNHRAIKTYKDHRMAMAFAPAALVHNVVEIEDPMVVTKSYPGFWNDLKKVGFNFVLM